MLIYHSLIKYSFLRQIGVGITFLLLFFGIIHLLEVRPSIIKSGILTKFIQVMETGLVSREKQSGFVSVKG